MKTLILTLSLLSLTAHAAVNTKISRVENNEIFAANGRVYEIDTKDLKLIKDLEFAKETGATVNLDLEEGFPFASEVVERITAVEVEEQALEQFGTAEEGLDPMTGYEPSNVSSLEVANEMFSKLKDRSKSFTQCFNRAHIWARQMHKDFGVKSQKILIYYTKKFRAEVDGKWWFHIAPMISVNEEKYVMDREFTNAPTTDVAWEAIFTHKMKVKGVGPADYRCAQIKNISEYYADANPAYCNIQHTSMYYWEPNDMENLDSKGIQKTQWINWELRIAAKGFLRDWKKVYEKYQVAE